MVRIDNLLHTTNVEDLNKTTNFLSKQVKNISDFSTIKKLSNYKVDQNGAVWKLGTFEKIVRNINDLFTKNHAITLRNAKTAEAIVLLRKNEFNELGNMEYKAKMLKKSMQVYRENILENLNNSNLSKELKAIIKLSIKNIMQNAESNIESHDYRKVTNLVADLKELKNSISHGDNYQSVTDFLVFFLKQNNPESISENHINTISNELLAMFENAMPFVTQDSDGIYQEHMHHIKHTITHMKLAVLQDKGQIPFAIEHIKAMKIAFNVCVSRKNFNSLDAFWSRERFIDKVSVSNITPTQKINVINFLHENAFALDFQRSQPTLELLNTLLFKNSFRPNDNNIKKTLDVEFYKQYQKESSLDNLYKQLKFDLYRDGIHSLGAAPLPQHGVRGIATLYRAVNENINDNADEFTQKWKGEFNNNHAKAQDQEKAMQDLNAFHEIARVAINDYQNTEMQDIHYYKNCIDYFIGDDKKDDFTPFVSYLVNQVGIQPILQQMPAFTTIDDTDEIIGDTKNIYDTNLIIAYEHGKCILNKTDNEIVVSMDANLIFHPGGAQIQNAGKQFPIAKAAVKMDITIPLDQQVARNEGENPIPDYSVQCIYTPL